MLLFQLYKEDWWRGLPSNGSAKLLSRHYLLGSIFGVTRSFTHFSDTTSPLVQTLCDIAEFTYYV